MPLGLIFTNTVEVMLDPADTNPADNIGDVVLTTGPDLYVEKTLVDGDLLPGETITFSLRFGNDRKGHEWWNMQGDAWLEDILPGRLEYVSADPPYDLRVGLHLFWFLGQMGAGHRDEIYLTARVTDTAEGDDIFTNWVEITSDQPSNDIEPYYGNNEDSYEVAIALPKFGGQGLREWARGRHRRHLHDHGDQHRQRTGHQRGAQRHTAHGPDLWRQ